MSKPRSIWTDERRAVVARDWPAGRPTRAIYDEICELPGPAPSFKSLAAVACEMGLRRPVQQAAKPRPAQPKAPRRAASDSEVGALRREVLLLRAAVGKLATRTEWMEREFSDCATAKPKPAKERKCLLCERPFLSEGAHNRICDACKTSTSWTAGISEHGVRA